MSKKKIEILKGLVRFDFKSWDWKYELTFTDGYSTRLLDNGGFDSKDTAARNLKEMAVKLTKLNNQLPSEGETRYEIDI